MSDSEIRHTPSAELQSTDGQSNVLVLPSKKLFNIWFNYPVRKR